MAFAIAERRQMLHRHTAELRHARVSTQGAVYFVTFCVAFRSHSLAGQDSHALGHAACRTLVDDRDVEWLTATVMPDHVHLLFQLGKRLALNRVIAKRRAQVRRSSPVLVWQANYFDHKLHPIECTETYAWYIFMNPYRAGLVRLDESWSGWWNDGAIPWTFLAKARSGPCPQPQWLITFDNQARGLITGEDRFDGFVSLG